MKKSKGKSQKSQKGEIRVLIAYQGKVMPLSIVGKLSPKTMILGESAEEGEIGEMIFSILKDARKAVSDVLAGKDGDKVVRWGTKLVMVDEGDGESSYVIDAAGEE